MEVTDVQVRLVRKGRVKALATVTIDDCLILRDLRIIAWGRYLYVGMPAGSRKSGWGHKLAHLLDRQTAVQIVIPVLGCYLSECEIDRRNGPESAGVRAPLIPPIPTREGGLTRDLRDDCNDYGEGAGL